VPDTYSVYNTIEVLESGLTFEQAFAELMKRAYCTWRWEYEAGETRIAVRYEGSLPEAYDSVRNIKSPYFRSRVPNVVVARTVIMRSFLRTGLLGIFMAEDGAQSRSMAA